MSAMDKKLEIKTIGQDWAGSYFVRDSCLTVLCYLFTEGAVFISA